MRLSHFCQLILRSKSTQINYYKCREGGITTKTMVVAFPLFYEHVLCYCSTNKFHDKMSGDNVRVTECPVTQCRMPICPTTKCPCDKICPAIKKFSGDEMSVWPIFLWPDVCVARCLWDQIFLWRIARDLWFHPLASELKSVDQTTQTQTQTKDTNLRNTRGIPAMYSQVTPGMQLLGIYPRLYHDYFFFQKLV